MSSLARNPTICLLLAVWLVAVCADGSGTRGGRSVPKKPLKKVVLQLKWHHQFQFAGYYAALDHGYYKEEGLDVEIREGGPEKYPVDLVVSGKADFGVASSDLIVSRMEGQPVIACAVIFQHSPYVLISNKESGIRSPSDLAGKRISISSAGGKAQFLAMIDQDGVSTSDIKFFEGDWTVDDLVAGKVDAISGYSSTQTPLVRHLGVVPYEIDPRDYGIDFYGDNLFTTEKMAKGQRDTTAAMIRASLKGWAYAMEHPEEMVDRILQMPEVVDRGIMRWQVEQEAKVLEKNVVPNVVDIGHMNAGRWANLAKIFADTGIATMPTETDWVDDFLFVRDKENAKVSLFAASVTVAVAGVIGLLAFLWSLMLRKKVEQGTIQVREQARLNQLILDTAMDAVIGVNQEGKVVSWNGRSNEIFEIGPQKAIGRPIETFLPRLFSTIEDDETEFHRKRFETNALRASGAEFPAELSISNVSESSAVRMNLFVRDVTGQRSLEETLRQSQKMQAIGQLAGGVAHDFNNLLTVIQVNAIMSRDDANESNRERIMEIISASERASGLTNQLLAFSRQRPMQMKAVQVNDGANQVCKMLKRLIGEDVRVILDLCAESTEVYADSGMLEQVLLNLAVNARDAMPNGGTLTIETRIETRPETDFSTSEGSGQGKYVRIRVADTGVGIGQAEISRIFEPFYTTKDVGKGTGLGLATVFGILQQHNGWITVESEVGEGTVFSVWIPLAGTEDHVEEQKTPVSGRRGERDHAGDETILLVEDEPMVRMIARKLLTKHGYHVIEAESGRAALEIWNGQKDSIDMLLTDIVMPDGVSGHDLAMRLQEERPGLPVIYSSGYSAEVFRGEAVFPDDAVFLGKPYRPEDLLRVTREVLDDLVLAS